VLYSGSAAYHRKGRMPYPPALAEALQAELGLDGTGRLLDVGCGPGSLTLLLAPLFAEAVGIDADAGMIAAAPSAPNVTFRHLRAEDLPADLGTFRVITFAQSFHWMDQPAVAARVRDMLEPGGAWVHVWATTHKGVSAENTRLWQRIADLVATYVPDPPDATLSGEEDVMRAAGYRGPTRLEIGGELVERTADQLVASVLSMSASTPHLLGNRLPAFVADLRRLLHEESPSGRFREERRSVSLVIWH
jgi:SAM-dependent methyltransferase